MRPLRLELQGFGSFRQRTVIDFEGADLFVLSGPTGSGKSTVIDGITFALYGKLPRYEDERLVAPVISNGMEEARVRLDFAVGERCFSAVRVVRRSPTGATTKEARLAEGDEVLAGTADELSDEATKLLGLTFDHFQKCVVLPQGAFDRLLHDEHRNRLALLRELLGIEMFGRIGQLANQRAQEAKQRAEVNEGRLSNELAEATEEALAHARTREESVRRLLAQLAAEAADLERLKQRENSARDEAARLYQGVEFLSAVRAPEGVERLARQIAAAAGEVDDAAQTLRDAEHAANAARERREALPEREAIEQLRRLHRERAQLSETIMALEARLDEAIRTAQSAAAGRDEAKRQLELAEKRREEVLKENYAFRAAQGLKAGDRCPVCGALLQTAPSPQEPHGWKEADEARQEAEVAHSAADEKARSAAATSTSVETDVARRRAEIAEIDSQLAGKPGPEAVEEQLAGIVEAEAETQAAMRELNVAAAAHREARRLLEDAETEAKEAWQAFDTARDTVAAFGPPAADRTDLAGSWTALVSWARGCEEEQRARAVELGRGAEDAAHQRATIVAGQWRRCEEANVPAMDGEPLDACRAALALAEAHRERIARDLETANALREQQRSLAQDERVARTLAGYLRSDRRGFEAWYVRRVLQHLVSIASVTLKTLSREQFSLGLNDKEEFEVIDHLNGDDRRFIRTLSGGETFLASLALALALADSIATVATGSTARLESIFLDEGFGTLDAETLDVVATAIEELAARGRVVGLVTHVPELAARVPTRFEVAKAAGGSTVQRVEA